MRLYIDLSCFNRPFDNQAQERIRLETEAVLIILTRVLDGKDTLLWSWVLSFENDKHPKADRREEIGLWEARSEKLIPASAAVEKRAVEFGRSGMGALDAVHLASAEAGGADILLTCDDLLVKRASRFDLGLRVLNPVAYLNEVKGGG